MILGGGRETKESEIDLSVGLVLSKKAGEPVKAGDTLVKIYGNDEGKIREAAEKYQKACHIGDTSPEASPFIKGIIRE